MLALEADLNTPVRLTQPYYQETAYSADAGLSMRLGVLSANFRDGEESWRWGLGVGIQRLTLREAGGTAFGRGYRATSLEAAFDRKVWSAPNVCLTLGAGGGLVLVTKSNDTCNEPFCRLGGNWTASVISRFEYAISGRVALVAGLRSWLWSPEYPFRAAPVLSIGIQVD